MSFEARVNLTFRLHFDLSQKLHALAKSRGMSANALLTQLVTRELEEPRCPKCGAQVDEHFDCCETHEKTRA